jgi:hypothetical protein
VRRDVERGLLDRMERAADATAGLREAVMAALLVGFDFAVRQDVQRLLGDPPPDRRRIHSWALLTHPATDGPDGCRAAVE